MNIHNLTLPVPVMYENKEDDDYVHSESREVALRIVECWERAKQVRHCFLFE